MSVKAICPNCNVPNDPSLTNCEVCKTALGALLIGDPGDGLKFGIVSASASLVLYMMCWMFELHPIMLLVSVFYGTLLTSYWAKNNVVWASAMGGLIAIVLVIVAKIALSYASHKGLFSALAGGPSSTNEYGDGIAKGKVAVGVVVALAALFPFCLIGASVGEHLSVRKRSKGTPVV